MFPELKAKWKKEDCAYPPASPDEVLAFEQGNSVTLPTDLRTYFLELNGTKPDGDSELFAFDSIDRLKPWKEDWGKFPEVPSGFDLDTLYIFCDYMISSWAYAIDLGPNSSGTVISCGWVTNQVIAKSFTEFIDLYLADYWLIFPPGSAPIPNPPLAGLVHASTSLWTRLKSRWPR